MTEKKFLALLNLYLDGEIDPAGVADLEREILANPARQRVYTDYCRIHRATKLVYEQFRAAADDNAATLRHVVNAAPFTADSESDRRTGGRATPSPFRTAVVLAGGMAAACALIATVATALRPSGATNGTMAAAPADAHVRPAATVATSTPVRAAPETIAAPFASGSRSDPYFVETAPTRMSPFSLVNWTNESERRQYAPGTWFELTPALRIDPQFRTPPSDEFSPTIEPTGSGAAQRLFRSKSEERPKAAVEPLSFDAGR